MQKNSRNTKGFALVEILIIVVVLLVVGAVGAYAYHHSQTAKKASNSSTTNSKSSTQTSKSNTTTTDPYKGWKSYTTKYDKLSFKYPSSWTLSDTSNTNSTDVTPGQDSVNIVSNDSLEVSIGTGDLDFFGWSGDQTPAIIASTTVSMLGGTHYLVFGGASGTSTTGEGVVTTSNAFPTVAILPLSKNVALSKSAVSGLPKPFDLIDIDYHKDQGTSNGGYPISKFQQDPNYKDALLVLESMTY